MAKQSGIEIALVKLNFEGVNKMKIGILTWYQALNYGAVLQAYALSKTLNSMSIEAVILRHNRIVNNKNSDFFSKVKRLIKRLLNSEINVVVAIRRFNREKRSIFDKFIEKHLKVGGYYYADNNLNAVCIGSDMVFEQYQGYNAYMFGTGVEAPYIFSYAASFGRTTIDNLNALSHRHEIEEGLKRMDAIAYRDANTREVVMALTARSDLVETIDPVLLYGFQEEIVVWDSGKWKSAHPYIAVYAYEFTFNASIEIETVKKYARKYNLEIISVGCYHKWCDKSICADPKEFLEILKHAALVVTDTFHGTIFSLIMKKRFVSILRGNAFKVKYMLENCGLEGRICIDFEQFASIADCEPDFGFYDTWIETQRTISKKYLYNQSVKAVERMRKDLA
jgi:hypothetical protein